MRAAPASSRSALLPLPVVLAGLVVLLQVAYPLTHGSARHLLTVVTVVAFFLASAVHALVFRGPRWTAAFLAVTVLGGFVAEAVGTATGVPFGEYRYAGSLGPQLLDVPLVIPLAWAMFGYPALLVGQRLSRSAAGAAALGGLALASWDLFLDPMMVGDGHWSFASRAGALPGAAAIPLSNYAGWLLVAVLMLGLLQALPRVDADDRQPAALFLWTWAGSVLANAVFLGRPLVALTGGVVMGLVAVPYALSLAGGRR
ncbi:MAG: hypothetical protein JWM64_2866 [Frankiales bacterium]|nr:hypothetical protein [Frankiales bacterium]